MTMPAENGAAKPNVLKRKIGPLPTWLWVLIVAAIILAWALYRRSQSSQQTASPQGVPAGDVPQFVNQTVVQPSPPGPPDEDEDNDKDDKHFPPVNLPPVPPVHPKPPGTRSGPPERKTSGPPTRNRPPQHHKRKRHAPLPGK